jgi:hypothetical protein
LVSVLSLHWVGESKKRRPADPTVFQETNVRGADLVISGVDDESSIIINFSFPKLDGNKLVQQAQKAVESF